MTMMYCEDIYGTAGHEKWSCLKKKDIAIVGNDKDEYGCIGSAGYSWNQDKQACIRPLEEAEDEVKMCTMQYDPVCGVDSKTYGNACSAGKVEIAYKGECNLSSLTNEETKDYEHVKTELSDKTKLDLKARLEKFSKSFSSLSKIKKERLKKQIDLLIVKNIRNLEKKDSLSQVENTMKNTLKMIRYEIKDMK